MAETNKAPKQTHVRKEGEIEIDKLQEMKIAELSKVATSNIEWKGLFALFSTNFSSGRVTPIRCRKTTEKET